MDITWSNTYTFNNKPKKEKTMKIDKIGYYKTNKDRIAKVVGFIEPTPMKINYTAIGVIYDDPSLEVVATLARWDPSHKGMYCGSENLVSYIGTTLTHTITIDGKDIEISHDSFNALKEQLT